jgi:hypothetical protein
MGKNNKNEWKWDLLILTILVFTTYTLLSNYDVEGLNEPGYKNGGVFIVLIDQLFGKQIVFIFLFAAIFLVTLITCQDYLKNNIEESNRKKWQILYVRFVKLITILFAITMFICLPVYAIVNHSHYNREIEKHGIETVIYISENVEQRRGHYLVGYFYANYEKHTYKIRYVSATNVDKFMKVKYLQKTPNRFRVDKKSNVPIDSVYQYFPKGKNPFEREIKRLKEREKTNVILYEMK